MNEPVAAPASREGLHLSRGGILGIILAVAFLGSLVFIAYVMARVRDATQIPMLSTGFVVLAIASALTAVWFLRGMWRAASVGRGGRAMVLAILGGLFALGAIGCMTVVALLTLVWTS